MPTTYTAAIDEIFALFLAEWQANAQTVLGGGYTPQIYWPGDEGTPNATKYWCRVTQQTIDSPQASFTDENSKKRYTTTGLVFVQLFCPKSDSQAIARGRKLAEVARSAFRGKTSSGNVWFSKAVINELTPEDTAYRFNIVADYEYDEIS